MTNDCKRYCSSYVTSVGYEHTHKPTNKQKKKQLRKCTFTVLCPFLTEKDTHIKALFQTKILHKGQKQYVHIL